MKLVELTCENCGAQLEVDLDRMIAYCPYCGQKLMINLDRMDTVLAEREKTKRLQMAYTYKEREAKRKSCMLGKGLFVGLTCLILFCFFLYWNENRKTELTKKAELTVDQKEEVLEREGTEEASERDAAGKISGRDTAEEITAREVLAGQKALTERTEGAVSELTDTAAAEKLEQIRTITDIQIATEDRDPNGQLGKQGGYTGCVFFRDSRVAQSDLASTGDAIDIGTDGGGSVELYAAEADAKRRDAYLASFDGTALSSGSHIVVGTVLVRTSCHLKASQQKEFTEEILEVLGLQRD